MLKRERCPCYAKPEPYIKIGRNKIMQTLQAISMDLKKIKPKFDLVCQCYQIKLLDMYQRLCYCSALRSGARSIIICCNFHSSGCYITSDFI